MSRSLRKHVRRVTPDASDYRIYAVADQLAALNSSTPAGRPAQTTPKPKADLKRTKGRLKFKAKGEALVASDGSVSEFAKSVGRAFTRWLPKLEHGEAKDLSPEEVIQRRQALRHKISPRRWAIRHEKSGHRRELVNRVHGYPHLGQKWVTLLCNEIVE